MKFVRLPDLPQTVISTQQFVWKHQTVRWKKLLTGSNDDGGGLVVDGHGAVVGGDGQPAGHLVQAPLHVRPVGPVAPGTVVRVHGFNLWSRASCHLA